MRFYYVPFVPAANINYLHLFDLYDLAEYREETKTYDTIRYTSINKLSAKLPFSNSTLSRILNNESYKEFLIVDKENKIITIRNNFPKGTKRAFVRLSAEEVNLFREKNDDLFTTYYIYLKYYFFLFLQKMFHVKHSFFSFPQLAWLLNICYYILCLVAQSCSTL